MISIVLAGGPCSGKSKSMEVLRQKLAKIGYKVVVIPELATEIRQNGLIHNEGVISKTDFQKLIFDLQIFKEDLYKNVMKKNEDSSKLILLMDRGLLDAKVYLSQDDYEQLLQDRGLSENDIYNRYNIVIHLESSANLGDKYYNNEDNQFRFSNIEQAKIQEEKSLDVWSKHPNFHIINNEKSFEDKIDKIERYVINQLEKIK